jgi:carboxyl-terminal processing protease
LSNPQGGAADKQPAPQPQTVAPPPPAPKPDAKNEQKAPDDTTPPDVVKKDDYQLNQAINLLKGLQIIGRK